MPTSRHLSSQTVQAHTQEKKRDKLIFKMAPQGKSSDALQSELAGVLTKYSNDLMAKSIQNQHANGALAGPSGEHVRHPQCARPCLTNNVNMMHISRALQSCCSFTLILDLHPIGHEWSGKVAGCCGPSGCKLRKIFWLP